ncbi:MAG: type II secretion system protein [Acidobacteria bacterium]|nr:MAG: type II secretion system protein [Acidobacteriota bacterium]
MADGTRRDGGSKAHREQGYNLVVLLVAITVLNTLIAAALPVWSTFNQREKEEELIFRGLQYAEAIRIFQLRHGRLPIRLEELIEVEPRSIRQLWPNPLAADGTWGLVIDTGPRGGQRGQQGGQRGGRPGDDEGRGRGPRDGGAPSQPGQGGGGVILGGGGGEQIQGPIRGVFSREGEEAIKTWMGSNNIADWQFTVDVLQQRRSRARQSDVGAPRFGGISGGVQPGIIPSGPNAGQPWPVNSGTIGRPFPPGIQVQTVTPPGSERGRDLNPQNPRGGNRPVQQPGGDRRNR